MIVTFPLFYFKKLNKNDYIYRSLMKNINLI